MKEDNDYEVFIVDRNRNIILSLDKDDLYFFNTTNFDNTDFYALKDNNIQHLIDRGLALKLDSSIIYKMYLGFINRPKCYNCKKEMGFIDKKGFGSIPT
jgi:hypothetical protein